MGVNIKKFLVTVINKKFNRLLCLERTDRRSKKGSAIYKFQCDCGNIYYSDITQVKRGVSKSCGCLHKEHLGIIALGKPEEASYGEKFRAYKGKAKRRGYKWELSYAHFKYIIKKECIYCGSKPKSFNCYLQKDLSRRTGEETLKNETVSRQWVKINGVDRIDNNVGYNLNNCIPCCKICNQAKSNSSLVEWINYLKGFDLDIELKINTKITLYREELKNEYQ